MARGGRAARHGCVCQWRLPAASGVLQVSLLGSPHSFSFPLAPSRFPSLLLAQDEVNRLKAMVAAAQGAAAPQQRQHMPPRDRERQHGDAAARAAPSKDKADAKADDDEHVLLLRETRSGMAMPASGAALR